MIYRIVLVNHADVVFSSREINADDDNAARTRARTEFRSGIGKGYQIWDGDRLVHSQVYSFA